VSTGATAHLSTPSPPPLMQAHEQSSSAPPPTTLLPHRLHTRGRAAWGDPGESSGDNNNPHSPPLRPFEASSTPFPSRGGVWAGVHTQPGSPCTTLMSQPQLHRTVSENITYGKMVTRFVTSPPTDNRPQPKEAPPTVSQL
jgi:hypothetical protein